MSTKIELDIGLIEDIKHNRDKDISEKLTEEKTKKETKNKILYDEVIKTFDIQRKNICLDDIIIKMRDNYDDNDCVYTYTYSHAKVTTFEHVIEMLNNTSAEQADIKIDLIDSVLEYKSYYESHSENELCCLIDNVCITGFANQLIKLDRKHFKTISEYKKAVSIESKLGKKHRYIIRFLGITPEELAKSDKIESNAYIGASVECNCGDINFYGDTIALCNKKQKSFFYS